MANKDNQSKQYRIYIKESKSWLDDMPDESAAIAEVLEDAELQITVGIAEYIKAAINKQSAAPIICTTFGC